MVVVVVVLVLVPHSICDPVYILLFNDHPGGHQLRLLVLMLEVGVQHTYLVVEPGSVVVAELKRLLFSHLHNQPEYIMPLKP